MKIGGEIWFEIINSRRGVFRNDEIINIDKYSECRVFFDGDEKRVIIARLSEIESS